MTRLSVKRGIAHQLGTVVMGKPPYTGMFAPTSFWNRKLADNAPIVSDSNHYATKLANQARYSTTSTPVASGNNPPYQIYMNQGNFSIPLWVMPAGYPTAKVQYIVGGVTEPDSYATYLQAACDAVPVPLIADLPSGHTTQLCAGGTDKSIVFWQPSTDKMWEFYHWGGTEGAYTASYGGFISPVSTSPGYMPNTWGLRATGLNAAGGLVTAQEVFDGSINHAIACAVQVRTGTHIAPATRQDGSGGTPLATNIVGNDTRDAVPEGLLCRLPANIPIDPTWSPFLTMLVKAIRDYGLIVVDGGANLLLYAEDTRTAGTQFSDCAVYANANLRAGGNPDFELIPWEQLQQVVYP